MRVSVVCPPFRRSGRAPMRRRALLAGLLVAAAAGSSPAVASAAPPCQDGQGWSLSTSTFDPNYTHHAFVGNGYLSQRVPATGMGYVSTGEKTGWPLYTPRYDGAFVAGLYGLDPTPVSYTHLTLPTTPYV